MYHLAALVAIFPRCSGTVPIRFLMKGYDLYKNRFDRLFSKSPVAAMSRAELNARPCNPLSSDLEHTKTVETRIWTRIFHLAGESEKLQSSKIS